MFALEMREVRRSAQVPVGAGMVAGCTGQWALAFGLAVVGLLAASIVALYGVRRASTAERALDRADESGTPSRRPTPDAISPPT